MAGGFIVTSTIPEGRRKLDGKGAEIKQAITNSLDQATRQGVGMARKLVRKKTGALSGSINAVNRGPTERWIGFGKWYGIIIEKGRKGFCAKGSREGAPGIGSFIAGAGAGAIGYNHALRFEYKGQTIYRRCVGPYKGDPFMGPTHDYLKVYYPKLMQMNIRSILKS